MAHVLVIYGTTEGQSRKIARRIAEIVELMGHSDELLDAADGPLPDDLSEYDAAFIVSSVHHGRYQAPVYQYIQSHSAQLNGTRAAFVSVSLAIMSKLQVEREEAKAFAQSLLDATGWHPQAVHHAAGALRYSKYDFFKKWIMRRVSRHEGGPTDSTRDYEFTDWEALADFVGQTLTRFLREQEDEAAAAAPSGRVQSVSR